MKQKAYCKNRVTESQGYAGISQTEAEFILGITKT